MKIEIELNDKILKAYDQAEQEAALDGYDLVPLKEWLIEMLEPMADCIIESNILDSSGKIYARRNDLYHEADDVAKVGGEFLPTYKALISAAELAAADQ